MAKSLVSINAVAQMTGLHLFHTDISNCCDRVRITLSEKQLPWEGHFFELPQGDHLTADFFRINPNGVVPVLVDDGVIVTDSNNIIEYLDQKFPEPSLQPASDTLAEDMRRLMASAASCHPYIAALSFEFLFGVTPYSPEFFQKRAQLKKIHDPAMEKMFDHNSGEVAPGMVKTAIVEVIKALGELNSALAGSQWLVGDQFSLADISWAVQIHRLITLRLADVDNFPDLARWYDGLAQRSSVKRGMLDWETPGRYAMFNDYLDQRESAGTDVNSTVWREMPDQTLQFQV